ncbi:MAG: hypothetical protein EZS28_047074 [Streblomastix strix]|uniref:Secreted protein n=1 Tax=Streblomastix strix TaxID=222440 RepID=A0A5J4TGZ7_9EUKA|nr:MAG: hypothetical protein EZS28_047074 [Streblomastix strix]
MKSPLLLFFGCGALFFFTQLLPCIASESFPRPQAKPQYPLVPAVHFMMRTARKWLDQNWAKMTRLMFVASSYREFHVLCELMLDYFPVLPTRVPSPPVIKERTPTPPPPPKIKKPKKKKKW